MKKLLIADATEDFILALRAALDGKYEIRTCQDGETALHLLRTFLPDAMVLELMLPGIDGITLLQKASLSGIRPIVLAKGRYINNYLIQSAPKLNIGYLMKSPCPIDAVLTRLDDLVRQKEAALLPPDPHEIIYTHLVRMGFPPKRLGFKYLCYCIPLYKHDDPQSVTKMLYGAIAEKFHYRNTDPIERAIRKMLHEIWEKRNESIWLEYLQPDRTGSVPRPTNWDFIQQMADFLQKKLNEH